MKPIAERYIKKRRIRKKLKTDEFVELGFDVTFKLARDTPHDDIDKFTDDIVDCIEANNLRCCGIVSSREDEHKAWYGIYSAKRYGSATIENIKTIKEFLENYKGLYDITCSDLKDFNQE